MKLKHPLPPGRTYEQILNHYQVEKEIAARLMSASREERKKIYAGMYDELFAKVPDHSRLTRRQDEAETRRANRSKFALVRRFVNPSIIFAEFAPGDCRFVMEVAPKVRQAFGIDISDQRNPDDPTLPNFRLIIYDGYNLDEVHDESIDVLFSDQLVEHFHPEDTSLHFQVACRILKTGGRYIFRTPHLFAGPHDISKYFSDTPQGFHLKEWTYTELRPVLQQAGFTKISSHMLLKHRMVPVPFAYFAAWEKILDRLPHAKIRRLAGILIREIIIIAVK
jgi:SAM-dependent methyltransferase